jgi:hypothetical protein
MYPGKIIVVDDNRCHSGTCSIGFKGNCDCLCWCEDYPYKIKAMPEPPLFIETKLDKRLKRQAFKATQRQHARKR